MTHSILRTAVLAAAAVTTVVFVNGQTPMFKRTVLLQHDTSAAGFEAVLVSVEILAGGREGRHTHPGTALIHVMEGAITLEQDGMPNATYKAGQSFFVDAGKVHEGMNRGSVSAKALATFIIPKGQSLTTQAAPVSR